MIFRRGGNVGPEEEAIRSQQGQWPHPQVVSSSTCSFQLSSKLGLSTLETIDSSPSLWLNLPWLWLQSFLFAALGTILGMFSISRFALLTIDFGAVFIVQVPLFIHKPSTILISSIKKDPCNQQHTPQTTISNLGLYPTINLSPAQIILFWSPLANSTTLPLHHKHNFVQFLLLSLCFGIPLLTFFLSTGQYLGSGLIDMWRISPVFQV